LKTLYWLLGVEVEAQHLTVSQVVLRAMVIFFATLVIVRFADKRFFAKKTAFDFILAFILASMMARAINGSEQILPTVAAGFVLALLHRFLGFLACRSKRFGAIIKGSPQTLIEDGIVNNAEMKRHRITEDDLVEELRLNGIASPKDARLAVLERSGEISVVQK
jgi:uncharacterized membrane protein YcaP (DUF421 family)